ncbi:MAG: TonB family protein [Acidobacteriaceae bacterium]
MLVALCLCLVGAPSSFGWGSKGHKMINRLAAESLPADMPAFLKTPEAINEIEYLGPEPDRWRSRAEPELTAEQAPDHFIDLELANKIGPLPRGRYEYIADLYAYIAAHPAEAAYMRPEKVGFQPYITEEVWQRLKSAMRDYRTLSAAHEDTKPVDAAILFYAGWLGHYVADGSQPLHTTIQYNGWVGPNPNGYTTSHDIHWKFESEFVDAAVNASDVQPLVAAVKTVGDEWDDYLAYLRHTNSLVEQVYQLDKQQAFDGTGTPEGKQFVAERLAAGASMLRDLYVAAWVKSAEPVPEWHAEAGSAPAPAVTIRKSESGATGQELDASVAAATAPFTGKIYRSGGGVSPPILRYAPNPQFTPEAKKARYQGVDVVNLIVDENGDPRNVHVVRPLGMGLDAKAVQAVSQYRFTPAMMKGKPVPVEVNIDVNFRLY